MNPAAAAARAGRAITHLEALSTRTVGNASRPQTEVHVIAAQGGAF
jgi:hypothetical protein